MRWKHQVFWSFLDRHDHRIEHLQYKNNVLLAIIACELSFGRRDEDVDGTKTIIGVVIIYYVTFGHSYIHLRLE